MRDIIELQSNYEFDVYPKRELTIVKGSGAKVYDENGTEYIDCVAGIGVASVGHANKLLAERVSKQMNTLSVNPGIFYNDAKALFLEKLMKFTPVNLNRAFLSNSGAEAIEGAIKFARYNTGKTDFVCAMKSFHGRTLGSLSATFKKEYKDIFHPLVPGFRFAPLNNLDKFKEQINGDTAGIIIELIQGEGGINICDIEFVKGLRELCDENDILLIVDEIQTGVGRTGKFLAIERYGVEADIICMAKALGGGVPIGAILCSDKLEIPVGKHGSTFGGNPIASAAGLAVLDYLESENLINQAEEKGEYFISKLRELNSDLIRNVRGKGLMIGIELKTKVKPYLLKLMEKKVLALPAGTTVIRLLPPLVISYEEIDLVVKTLGEVL